MTTPPAPGAPEGVADPGSPQPTPGAQPQSPPAQPTQGQPPAPGAPAAKPADDDGKPETQDVSKLPDWAQKLIKDARADAAKSRTTAKQTAADEARQQLLAEINKALGLDPDAEPTLDDLKAQLAEKSSASEEAEARLAELAYENAVNRIGAKNGLDVDAALDSAAFQNAVGAELGEDFDDDDLRTAVEKVAKEFAKKPRFAASNGAPPRGGADITGGPTPPPQQRPSSLSAAVRGTFSGT